MKVKTETKSKKILKLKKAPRSGESSLNKAVKNVTEILKKKVKEDKVEAKKDVKLSNEKNIIKIKNGKKSSRKLVAAPTIQTKNERGVVYIGHIPHGFYEEQMKKYFSQFGKVTNIRVSRSKKTGESKGYGFIEFLHPEVAKIAAESMNNYLMFGRLVKTEYIPPEKQHNGYFKGGTWSIRKYPKLQRRIERTKKANNSVPNQDHKLFVKKSIKNLTKLSEKLKAAGIELNMKLGDVEI